MSRGWTSWRIVCPDRLIFVSDMFIVEQMDSNDSKDVHRVDAQERSASKESDLLGFNRRRRIRPIHNLDH